jgi:UDP-N-acetylglucosamine 1-carboxyvinyltransferase
MNGISAARVSKGWTQQELADALGVIQQQVQRWESGKFRIKTAVLMRIGEALDVDWTTLVEDESQK